MVELLINKASKRAHKTINIPKPKDKLKSEEMIGGIIVPAKILPLKYCIGKFLCAHYMVQ